MRFVEKTVLITGAGSGIGQTMAIRFAQEGASVAVNDINFEKAEQTAHLASKVAENKQKIISVCGDVSNVDDVERMVQHCIEDYGKIDVLINNAGIPDMIIPTQDQEIEQWQRVIDVHLRGSFLCSKYVGKTMIERKNGKIINISSIAGLVGLPKRNAYSAAKAGIIMLTKVLACEWAKYGINVNAVAPGYIMTPLIQELIAQKKVDHDKLRRRIPLGNLGEPSDIYHAVSFLASDDSKYITGICLPVDGGWLAFGDSGDAYQI